MKKRIFIIFVFVFLIGPGAIAKVINVPKDYPTIQEAVDAASPGDKIIVNPGVYPGAVIDKRLEIKGSGNNTRITAPNPMSSKTAFWIQGGAEGSEISCLAIDLAVHTPSIGIFGGDNSNGVNNIKVSHLKISGQTLAVGIYSGNLPSEEWTVSHNEITGASSYGIYIRRGNRWMVSHNTIRETGFYGIHLQGGSDCEIIQNTIVGIKGNVVDGILLNASWGNPANNNLIAFNNIVQDGEEYGFQYHGIRLRTNRDPVRGNIIVHNRIMISNPIAIQYSVAIALKDNVARGGGLPVITDNIIEFNDLRGSTTGLLLVPEELKNWNVISKNKEIK